MENVEHFGTLTERMKEFREEVLDEKPYIDAQRAILATLAYKENLNQPRVMVRAKMLEKVLDNMSIYIEDKSLLAGNQATKNRNAPIFPEYTMEFVMKELDQFEKMDGDVFYITEKTKEQLREIAPFWQNNNLRARGEALLPEAPARPRPVVVPVHVDESVALAQLAGREAHEVDAAPGRVAHELDAVLLDRPPHLGDVGAEVVDARVVGDGAPAIEGLDDADPVLHDELGLAVALVEDLEHVA